MEGSGDGASIDVDWSPGGRYMGMIKSRHSICEGLLSNVVELGHEHKFGETGSFHSKSCMYTAKMVQ